VLSQNLAQLILDASQNKLPKTITLKGATVFSKVEFPGEVQRIDIPPAFHGKIKLSTPPFRFRGSTISFIVARDNSIKSAQATLTDFINYTKTNLEAPTI
jgi:hypothetical protein